MSELIDFGIPFAFGIAIGIFVGMALQVWSEERWFKAREKTISQEETEGTER